MIDKAHGFGYRNLGFILDRGYFSRKNLAYMDQMGYGFLIMVKGMKSFIREIILENMGSFENKRSRYNDRFDVYGTTIERRLFDGEEQKQMLLYLLLHKFLSDKFGEMPILPLLVLDSADQTIQSEYFEIIYPKLVEYAKKNRYSAYLYVKGTP